MRLVVANNLLQRLVIALVGRGVACGQRPCLRRRQRPAGCAPGLSFGEHALLVAELGATRAIGMPRTLESVQLVAVVRRFELAPELAVRARGEIPQRHGPGTRVVLVWNDRYAPSAAAPEN